MGKRGRFSTPPARPRPQTANLLAQAISHLDAGRLQEAEFAIRLVLAARPQDGDALNLKGVIALKRGDYAGAIQVFERAAKTQPRNPGICFNLGNAYLQTNQLEAAIAQYEAATRLRPGYADAEALKGDALRKIGRWTQAASAYQRALQSKKDHVVALNGYGLCLSREGDPAKAAGLFREALAHLLPQDNAGRANVMANLGSALLQTGKAVEGLSVLAEAAQLVPENNEIARLLAQSLQQIRDVPDSEGFAAILLRLLNRNDVNPQHLASAVVTTLKRDTNFVAALAEQHWDSLAGNHLFLSLLQRTPIPDRDIELALTNLRRSLLLSEESGGAPLELVCALAQQCFLNEYVYSVTEAEEAAVAALRNRKPAGENWAVLALLACYLPLGKLDQKPVRDGAPACVTALFEQQIDQPNEERALAADIPSLTTVTDSVSKAVQEQYEENPYPRWAGFSSSGARPFREAVRDLLPHVDESKLPLTDRPRVLVAGCGTGQETMRTVGSYETASVLAIDLSRASMGYAMRKLADFGVAGVEHCQADILELERLDRRFDFITSFGVIHHLADPARGLNILARLLEPGGYLYLGLYSAIARRPVTDVRKLIAGLGIQSTPAGIRRLRRMILTGETGPELAMLASPASDFWTMSECRDLMFHVEERQFTLPQIGEMFDATGLEFLGLQVPHAPDLTLFRQENEDASAIRSLSAWHRFEERHPQTFGGMYQLWARKTGQVTPA